MNPVVFKMEICFSSVFRVLSTLLFLFLNLVTKASLFERLFHFDINDLSTSSYNVTSIVSSYCLSQCETKLSHQLPYSQRIVTLFLSQT